MTDVSRVPALGFRPQVLIEQGVGVTTPSYRENRQVVSGRDDVLKQEAFV